MKDIVKKTLIILSAYLVGCGIGYGLVVAYRNHVKRSDAFAMSRILQLRGNNIACTGTQIIAPSGKPMTLTAAHCKNQIVDNKIGFKDASGQDGMISVIAIDERLDLMLLEGTNKGVGFKIADRDLAIDDSIHTMTHGWIMPAYRTDGMVMTTTIRPDEPACEKYINIGGFRMGVGCQIPPQRTLTTAWVLPGSSGGPLLNEDNDLVGIVYALTGPFSYSVGLKDIKEFLKGK